MIEALNISSLIMGNSNAPMVSGTDFIQAVKLFPDGVRQYFAWLTAENAILLRRIEKDFTHWDHFVESRQRSLDRANQTAEIVDRIDELREIAVGFSHDDVTPEKLEALAVEAEAFLYPANLEPVRTRTYRILRPFFEVDASLWDFIDSEGRGTFFGVNEETLSHSLPNASHDELARYCRLREETGRFMAVINLTNSDSDVDSPVFFADTDRAVPLKTMQIQLEKLNGKRKALYAWLHNRLLSLAVGRAGSLTSLRDAVEAAEGNDVAAEVLRQVRESQAVSGGFQRVARQVKADAFTDETVTQVFATLATALRKPSCVLLRRPLNLLLTGCLAAFGTNPDNLKTALDAADPAERQVLYAAGICVRMPVVRSPDGKKVIPLGAVDPKDIVDEKFDPVKAWKALSVHLTPDERCRLAYTLQGAVLIFDEVCGNAPLVERVAENCCASGECRWDEFVETVLPVRQMLLPAFEDVFANSSRYSAYRSERKLICDRRSWMTLLADRLAEAVDRLGETADELTQNYVNQSIIVLGMFCVSLISFISTARTSSNKTERNIVPAGLAERCNDRRTGEICRSMIIIGSRLSCYTERREDLGIEFPKD